MIIEAKNGFVVLIAEEGKIFKSKVSGDILNSKARNPTGFRLWDEWR